jgi:hypothetical protein
MRKTIVTSIIVLMICTVSCAEAADRVVASNEEYVVKMNDKGVFWIEDNVQNMTVPLEGKPTGQKKPLVSLEGKPTGQTGVYEVICGETTRKVVHNVAGISLIIEGAMKAPLHAKILTWLAKAIYDEMCARLK